MKDDEEHEPIPLLKHSTIPITRLRKVRKRSPQYDRGLKQLKTKQWVDFRLIFLRAHPLCQYCEADHKRTRAAQCIDHVKPRAEMTDIESIVDESNCVASCHSCHATRTNRHEHPSGPQIPRLQSDLDIAARNGREAPGHMANELGID